MQARLFRMEPAPDARWMTVEALVDDPLAQGFRLRLSAAHGLSHRERWSAGAISDEGLDIESGLLWLRAAPSPVELALVVELHHENGIEIVGGSASLAAGVFEAALELSPMPAVGAPFEVGFSAVEELPWHDHSTDPNQPFEVAAAEYDAPPSSASQDGIGIPGDLPRPASDVWDLRNGRLVWWEPLAALGATELQVVWLDLDGGSGQARLPALALDELRLLPSGDVLCGVDNLAFVVDTVAAEARQIEVNVKAGRRLSAHRSKLQGKRRKKQGLR